MRSRNWAVGSSRVERRLQRLLAQKQLSADSGLVVCCFQEAPSAKGRRGQTPGRELKVGFPKTPGLTPGGCGLDRRLFWVWEVGRSDFLWPIRGSETAGSWAVLERSKRGGCLDDVAPQPCFLSGFLKIALGLFVKARINLQKSITPPRQCRERSWPTSMKQAPCYYTIWCSWWVNQKMINDNQGALRISSQRVVFSFGFSSLRQPQEKGLKKDALVYGCVGLTQILNSANFRPFCA